MRWSPEFNRDNCNKWISTAKDLNILNVSESVGHLNPPFNIVIDTEIHKDILKIYPPNEEKGGLMFAAVKVVNETILLNIESIHEVRNDVEIYFPGNSKANSYFPNKEQYLKLLTDNFSQKDDDTILLPIHFHTHPTKDKFEDIKYYYQLMHPLNPSEADIEVSNTRHIQLNNFKLLYLNAIITGDNEEHRIMFYGKKVTPESYTREKSKQIIDTIVELTDDIEDERWKVFTRIAIGGLAVFSAIKAPMLVPSMVDNFAYTLDKKEFWGKLEKQKETVIKIPFRKLDDEPSQN